MIGNLVCDQTCHTSRYTASKHNNQPRKRSIILKKTSRHFELVSINDWIGQHFTSPDFDMSETQLDIAYGVLVDMDGQEDVDIWGEIIKQLSTLAWPIDPIMLTQKELSAEGASFWIMHFYAGNIYELSELLVNNAYEMAGDNLSHPWHSIVKANENVEAQWLDSLSAHKAGRIGAAGA